MRRTLAVAVLALWALIGLPGSAHAGGPTSVLITNPESGAATALYTSSGAYADLERVLSEDPKAATSNQPSGGGVDYNVTWLIHDVQPWRLDTVRITTDGLAFVATTFVSDPADLGQGAEWREVAQPRQLAAILDRAFDGAGSKDAPQAVVETDPVTAPAVPTEPATRWFSLTGWRWAVPGVLGGLLVGLLATRRRSSGEPRRVLVDGSPTEEARSRSASPARS